MNALPLNNESPQQYTLESGLSFEEFKDLSKKELKIFEDKARSLFERNSLTYSQEELDSVMFSLYIGGYRP